MVGNMTHSDNFTRHARLADELIGAATKDRVFDVERHKALNIGYYHML